MRNRSLKFAEPYFNIMRGVDAYNHLVKYYIRLCQQAFDKLEPKQQEDFAKTLQSIEL